MKQTPVHEDHNPDLLRMIPSQARSLIEIGCSSGALAREFKKHAPHSDYFGVEIDPAYAQLASRHCDGTAVLDIETADAAFWQQHAHRDCWIFGDTLEHLRDPWRILRQIRAVIPGDGVVVVCVPNLQHWSLQVRLNAGNFRYEDSGLLDRTHLRWFTRMTLLEMFEQTGFAPLEGAMRVFEDPQREAFLPLIAEMARLSGGDPETAVQDAIPHQFVIKAAPA